MSEQDIRLTEYLDLFTTRMKAETLPPVAIETFAHYYRLLYSGDTGMIPEETITPVESLPDSESFSDDQVEAGQIALPKTVIFKLNGGLGTGMGLNQAKSLLKIKNGFSFLDVIAKQVQQAEMPLVLMNSFATRTESLDALSKHHLSQKDIPLDFLQHKVPKINQQTLRPVEWSQNPDLEWCPPGHGDIYTALVTTGMLDRLLAAGYGYAFVANADNLGAVVDPAILGYFVQNELPFMMEVADRTEADRKGGHLTQYPDGQLILRESAQCPADDIDAFQDINKHKYFNTNNLWINLTALKKTLAARNNILGLAMIRNAKTVDPRDATSTPVYQLETAMGSAIGVFKGAGAVRVPRTRFAPVKTTNDLLAVRSDVYQLTDDFRVIPNPARKAGPLVVDLDPRYYKLVTDLDARFPHGAPSLIECERLRVIGDVRFGKNVIVRGKVEVENPSPTPLAIEDGTVLEG